MEHLNELSKALNCEKSLLAGSRIRSWNTLWPSLVRMYEQLVEMGFEYIDGEVVLMNKEEYHE